MITIEQETYRIEVSDAGRGAVRLALVNAQEEVVAHRALPSHDRFALVACGRLLASAAAFAARGELGGHVRAASLGDGAVQVRLVDRRLRGWRLERETLASRRFGAGGAPLTAALGYAEDLRRRAGHLNAVRAVTIRNELRAGASAAVLVPAVAGSSAPG